MSVPTYYVRLLADSSFDRNTCRNVRLFIYGSVLLLADTFTEFSACTGHTILERYGMSETAILTSNPYHGERRGDTVGLPLPGVSLCLMRCDQAGHSTVCGADEIGDI